MSSASSVLNPLLRSLPYFFTSLPRPILLGNVRCLGDVFTRHEQKLISGARDAGLAVRPILFALIESFRRLFRRPFNDQKHLWDLSLPLEPFHVGRARQKPAAMLLNHSRHVLDLLRHPAPVRDHHLRNGIILHVDSPLRSEDKPSCCRFSVPSVPLGSVTSVLSLFSPSFPFTSFTSFISFTSQDCFSQILHFLLLHQSVSPRRNTLQCQRP